MSSTSDFLSLIPSIQSLEQERYSRALLLASINLDMDILAPLYEVLVGMPCDRPLDVVFYSRGGIVNAARRVALLLREFFPQVRFLVPHYCESAGTLTILSADEVITSPVAVFSPIDPLLSASENGEGPAAMSVQDIRLFSNMSQDWFNLEKDESNEHALKTVCESIFPTTLTSFHRCTMELEMICEELLSYSLPDNAKLRKVITKNLIYGYHSHSYAITADELMAMGLPVQKASTSINHLLWNIGGRMRQWLGAGSRKSDSSPWYDALLLTTQSGQTHQRYHKHSSRWLQLTDLPSRENDA